MVKPRIRSAYIYLTERCTLRCGYCYFRYKRARDLSRMAVEKFLALFDNQLSVPDSFIISGGEPLICWDEFRWLAVTLRRRFPGAAVHLQTNGTLLNPCRIAFIKRVGITMEFGIDGGEEVTIRHRCGLSREGYQKLVRHISSCTAQGIRCGATMTVHPDAAGDIFDQISALRSVGFGHVDVTPAAFMPWDEASIKLFRSGYNAIMNDTSLRGLLLTNEDRAIVHSGEMDISLHPPGYLLAGDAFLCLPKKKMAEFSLWGTQMERIRPAVLLMYQREYAKLYLKGRRVNYRETVCCNFKLVNMFMGREYINTGEIIPLMKFLMKTHLSMMVRRRK